MAVGHLLWDYVDYDIHREQYSVTYIYTKYEVFMFNLVTRRGVHGHQCQQHQRCPGQSIIVWGSLVNEPKNYRMKCESNLPVAYHRIKYLKTYPFHLSFKKPFNYNIKASFEQFFR